MFRKLVRNWIGLHLFNDDTRPSGHISHPYWLEMLHFDFEPLLSDPQWKCRVVFTKKRSTSLWILLERQGCVSFAGQLRGYLLGDFANALRHFLLTPFLRPITPAQEHYNDPLCKFWAEAEEEIFGNLKWRFASIHFGFYCRDVNRSQWYLTACAVLHNICVDIGHMDFLLDDLIIHANTPRVYQALAGSTRRPPLVWPHSDHAFHLKALLKHVEAETKIKTAQTDGKHSAIWSTKQCSIST